MSREEAMPMTADRVNEDQLTGIPAVLARMDALLKAMPPDLDTQRTFLATYRRTTVAVGEQVEQGRFEDPAWVDRRDVAFADLYVSALEARVAGREVPRPWRRRRTCRRCVGCCSGSTPTSTTTCRSRSSR